MKAILPILLASALPAFAEQSTVLAEVVLDFTGDDIPERAVLIQEEPPYASLIIYQASLDGTVTTHEMNEQIWAGTAAGQEAGMAVRGTASLAVTSQNYSIGRNRWEQTLTIAYRDDAFVIAGFTHRFFDTLDLKNTGGCDVNYLNGKANRFTDTGEVLVSHQLPRTRLRDWDGTGIPNYCFEVVEE